MSKHHRDSGYLNIARKLRKHIGQQLPLPCNHCGRPVHADQPWDVAHVIDLALGGDPYNVSAAHRSCNRSDGGKRGARKTNSQRRKDVREW